ncbi:MAG: glycosyltransferase [Candidatus Hydrogenedentes bacterium]|nr:glycosyltransferase [Candidatus Hydrogenedentota bacterium]
MSSPRVLTFNFHEPYLCLMARMGIPLDVGLYSKPRFARPWHTQFRPIPPGITLVEEEEWRRELAAGHYDVVVAHNELNAIDLLDCGVPCLLVCHNRRSFLETTVDSDIEKGKASYKRVLDRICDQFTFVYISESKRDDYGMPGIVIPPGIDVEEYGGYTGETGEVLRVGNAMRARDLMFDVDFQDRVCASFPNRVLGDDPGSPKARPSKSFEDLLDHYRRLRCYLHVTREAYEDGYNLAMLEAMACGMPVVSLANKTSPLTDGIDGYVSDDADVLRERIAMLLKDTEHARALGDRGRETVARVFPIEAFARRWREAIERAAERKIYSSVASGAEPFPRLNVLMEYLFSPITTARYFEQALRKDHNVITGGRCLSARFFAEWGLPGTAPAFRGPDVTWGPAETYAERLQKLRKDFEPSLLFWVDSGIREIPGDIASLSIPRVGYVIDTQFALDIRLELAKRFDFTFLAQRTHVRDFIEAGVPNVAWMPLGCSPELHAVEPLERIYDVAFVGGIPDDPSHRRRRLLDAVRKRFPNSCIGQFWPADMARIYAQAKIVINIAADRDVNMRVFEAMASGALLITDEAEGLEELFEDGKHLVIYRNDDAVPDVIERYLADGPSRERIAAEGRKLVFAKHTYQHRTRQMILMVLEALGALGGYQGESRFNKGGYYRSPRPELAAHVPKHTVRLLDCGCGGGEFGLSLKRRGVREVVGIEIVERAWELAKRVLDDALFGSIEDMELPFEDEYFDCVVFGDVLEHLVDPVKVLRKVSRVLSKDGAIVMSIPNVRFWQTVEMHVNGRWQYEDAGIMDRTHLRFFCAPDMQQMVMDAGLEVLTIQPLSMWPAENLPRDAKGCLRLGKLTIGPLDDQEYQDFLVYQYLVIAVKPGMDRLIGARHALEEKDYASAFQLAKETRGANRAERAKLMARAVARMGQLDTAESLYREVLRMQPEDAETAGELGIVLIAANRLDDAKPLLERAYESDSQNDRVAAGLGLVRLSEGRPAEAFSLFVSALDIKFDNAAIVMRLVETAEALGRAEEAEPYLRRFVEFYPGDTAMACQLAALLHRMGRNAEARDRLETLLLLAPGHPQATALLAALDAENNEERA